MDATQCQLQERNDDLKRITYRKLAFEHCKDRLSCAHRSFGILEVLEAAHLDCQRHNQDVNNLVRLCPTSHKVLDLDLISTDTMIQIRDQPRVARWVKRMAAMMKSPSIASAITTCEITHANWALCSVHYSRVSCCRHIIPPPRRVG